MEAGAREWAVGLLLGCVASFRADVMKEFSERGRDGSAWEAPLGDFLSKWLIHKMPPLRSPEATGHCQVLPHPWGVAFKSGGGAQAMQRGQEPHMFCSETLHDG